jgi:hypothetical protein
MGGESKQSTDTTQSSSTQPWAPAQGLLTGILGQLGGNLASTGLTGTENAALGTLSNNASRGNPFAGQINSYASNLLQGGGATDQAGQVSDALTKYQGQLTPYANGSMIGNNPALKAQLDQIRTDVGNDVNSQFAAAGRDMSGANQMAYGRGVAAGQAPVIAGQYNQDVANQLGAASSLYGAGNTTAGLLSGLQQQKLVNQGAGVTAAGQSLDANNYGANAQLAIEAQRRGIPVQALGLLAQIGIPIAALGQQTTGQGHSDTTKEDSGWTQFGQATGGIKNLFSDKRLKVDIQQVGELFDGQPIYRYRYLDSPIFHIGVLAQEVEQIIPDAVSEAHGFKTVDYKLATENAVKLREAA